MRFVLWLFRKDIEGVSVMSSFLVEAIAISFVICIVFFVISSSDLWANIASIGSFAFSITANTLREWSEYKAQK